MKFRGHKLFCLNVLTELTWKKHVVTDFLMQVNFYRTQVVHTDFGLVSDFQS